MYQVACFGLDATKIEDLERLQVDWEREKNHCNSILYLEILLNDSFMQIHPLLQLLYL